MKKKIISLALLIFLATGCFKKGNEDIINSLNKKIDGIETYYIKGELEIINNEDSYLYNVEVAYQKEDKFILVPYHTINGEGLLKCIKPEKVYIEKIGYKNNLLVAFSSSPSTINGVEVLLHKDLMKG